MIKKIFRKKTIEDFSTQINEENELSRDLSLFSIVLLGIGAIVGSGIFVITGTAASQHAGPAITISFIISAIGCLFAALCYAEFVSLAPISGSAYSYSYLTMGEIFAWVLGWDLILEYALSISTVSVGWSGYFDNILSIIGINLPEYLLNPTFALTNTGLTLSGSIINLPAVFIIAVIAVIVIKGIKESSWTNTLVVLTKIIVIFLVIGFGISFINPSNWIPFIPPNTGTFGKFGLSGILTGAGVVFISYIGFDALTTLSQETKNPKRNIPIAIVLSLIVCTILYVLVSLVLTGIVNYTQLNVPAPFSLAVTEMGANFSWLNVVVNIGAIFGITSVLLVMQTGLSRIAYNISKDGLLPKLFSKISKFKTPYKTTIIVSIACMVISGLFPISFLSEMVSIGTLLAFTLVSLSVLVLRKTNPQLPRGFKVPLMPLIPILAIVICLSQMIALPVATWLRLLIWMLIGLIIYGIYGFKNSKLSKD
ncbi:MAG: amino acid permease [Methanobrevibacter sp.]|jgi:APA family basic amino acid/polyamine antiporter|nr:amino acid permease [Candidatus Methanoflexus mossambicus]